MAFLKLSKGSDWEDGSIGEIMFLGLGLVMTKIMIDVEAMIMIDARAMIIIDA